MATNNRLLVSLLLGFLILGLIGCSQEKESVKEVSEEMNKSATSDDTNDSEVREKETFIFDKEIANHLLDLTDSIDQIKGLHNEIDHRYNLLTSSKVKELFDERFKNFILNYTLHETEEVQKQIPKDLEAVKLYENSLETGVQAIEQFNIAIAKGDQKAYLQAEEMFEQYKTAKMDAYKGLTNHIKN